MSEFDLMVFKSDVKDKEFTFWSVLSGLSSAYSYNLLYVYPIFYTYRDRHNKEETNKFFRFIDWLLFHLD